MSDDSLKKAVHAFGDMLQGIGNGCRVIGQALSQRLDVPYFADRESEKLLGHRYRETSREEALKQGLFPTRRHRMPDGTIMETDTWPTGGEQLTDEVWTKDHWPDSYNDVPGALAKLQAGITGIYFHRASLNLVLVSALGVKVGIRSTCLRFDTVRDLGQLKKAATA